MLLIVFLWITFTTKSMEVRKHISRRQVVRMGQNLAHW